MELSSLGVGVSCNRRKRLEVSCASSVKLLLATVEALLTSVKAPLALVEGVAAGVELLTANSADVLFAGHRPHTAGEKGGGGEAVVHSGHVQQVVLLLVFKVNDSRVSHHRHQHLTEQEHHPSQISNIHHTLVSTAFVNMIAFLGIIITIEQQYPNSTFYSVLCGLHYKPLPAPTRVAS